MDVPNYQELMLPALEAVAEHGPVKRSAVTQFVADKLQLSEKARTRMLSNRGLSGRRAIVQIWIVGLAI